MPSKIKLNQYIDQIYQRNILTNNGPLVQELTQRLKEKLGVKYLLLVNNGTTSLLLAYHIKNLVNKTIITTPYTFAATSTAIKWLGANVLFADIDNSHWNLSPESVEQKLATGKGDAIVPVNLFGVPCDLDAFEELKSKYNIPLIYDSAHALLSEYKGKNIYQYGDIHSISFHATKLFHCIEGGALIFNQEADYIKAKNLINFGIDELGDIHDAGINGKLSEFHAAMGLCVLDELDELVNERDYLVDYYKQKLGDLLQFQTTPFPCVSQPIYMPVQFATERLLCSVEEALKAQGVFARRYFLPQHYKFLELPELQGLEKCSDIANRVLCLPLFNGMTESQIDEIVTIIKDNI
ncbi:DegT/DnrJ/EryC1/StrS family aminotransferase [Thalassotalea sp. SU-HH00458]